MTSNQHRVERISIASALLALILSVVVVFAPANVASATEFANSGITKVATGATHTCAIKSGEVFCWGANDKGQLGDGTTTQRLNPVSVVDGSAGFTNSSVTDIAVGDGATCAVKSGTIYCWGANDWKQLGVNATGTSCTGQYASTECSSTPVKVSDGDTANSGFSLVAISTWHACGVKSGVVYCWGGSGSGRLGINDTSLSASCSSQKCTHLMKQVSNNGSDFTNSGVTAISVGSSFTCVLRTAQMNCWGGNQQQQLGNASLSSSSSSYLPVKPDTTAGQFDSSTVTSVSTGFTHTCAVSGGKVFCWGSNGMGQATGTASTPDSATPTAVAADGTFTNTSVDEVQAGYFHTCARENSTVFCWGLNSEGRLGTGNTTSTTSRVKVVDGEMVNAGISVLAVGSTAAHSCAIKGSSTSLYCWGSNTSGKIGNGVAVAATSPKLVVGPPAVITPANPTAVLKTSFVEITMTDVPASGLNNIQITVAPKTYSFAVPPSGMNYTSYTATTLSGGQLPTVTNNTFTVRIARMSNTVYTNGVPAGSVEEFVSTGEYHVWYIVTGSATSSYPNGWRIANNQPPSNSSLSVTANVPTTTAPATTAAPATTETTAAPATTAATATTAAPTTTTVTSTTAAATTTTTVASKAAIYSAATPGVTVTDTKVYTTPPAEVAASSSITMLSAAQNRVMDIVTQTPAVCLPNDEELVFINDGKCIAQVVNAKTRAVLRVLKTTVVAEDIADVQVGNAVITLAPIYFDAMSSTLDASALARIKAIKSKVSAAGSVLVIGHSGTLNGNSPANIAIAKARALATVAALKASGAEGPFAISSVGALVPATTGKTEADQSKNRRVVIALIP